MANRTASAFDLELPLETIVVVDTKLCTGLREAGKVVLLLACIDESDLLCHFSACETWSFSFHGDGMMSFTSVQPGQKR